MGSQVDLCWASTGQPEVYKSHPTKRNHENWEVMCANRWATSLSHSVSFSPRFSRNANTELIHLRFKILLPWNQNWEMMFPLTRNGVTTVHFHHFKRLTGSRGELLSKYYTWATFSFQWLSLSPPAAMPNRNLTSENIFYGNNPK